MPTRHMPMLQARRGAAEIRRHAAARRSPKQRRDAVAARQRICAVRRCFTGCAQVRGFSLVELMVVLGAVAILIALLLPSLQLARQHAEQVKCLATLRNIWLAASIHASDHQGYLPAAGWYWNCTGGVCNPAGMDDPQARRYDYYLDNGVRRPMPVTGALAMSLGVRFRTDSREELAEDMMRDSVRRLFHCPSQQEEYQGITQRGDEGGRWLGVEETSGYVFNEGFLGRPPAPYTQTAPLGKLSQCGNPSKMFFAADGRPRDQFDNRYFLVYEFSGPTLYDFQRAILNSPHGSEALDFFRHRLRINAAFLDGHASTFSMGLPPEGGDGLKDIDVGAH